jgi:hypothetical protein
MMTSKDEFTAAFRMALEIDLLESAKAHERKADFDSAKLKGGNLILKNARYKTRMRHNQKVQGVFLFFPWISEANSCVSLDRRVK